MTTVTGTVSRRELPLEPGGTVEVMLPAGAVRVRATDGDRVVVHVPSGRAIDDVLAIDAGPAVIRIQDLGRGFRLGPLEVRTPFSEDVELEIPRTAGISVRTMSGDIEAAGIGGRSRWATASGDIQVELAGGPVAIETMSGDVELESTAAIDLSARSVSGDLRLRAPRIGSLVASTTSGDVHLEAALMAGGTHRLSSVSGDIELVTGSPVAVATESITGDVRVSGRHTASGSRNHRSIVVGDGSVEVAIRTTSGDIRIATRADATASTAASPAAASGAVASPTVASPTAASPSGAVEDAPKPSFVAEAEAAPNLVRPAAAGEPADGRDADRLEVLRALERGELDVATAARRLEALDATTTGTPDGPEVSTMVGKDGGLDG
jgi:hypothetical protein